MELVDGPSLEQEINAGRRFDWNETLSIAIQMCRALKHAHDHGVVHRDIKPANLLLDQGRPVKIADFGIARLFGATQLTTAGGILGTADYMSPEQVDGRPVTDRCDQYALGCVMFALLAGRPPFRAKTMPEMLQLQRFAEPEPVRRYAPQTPEQLDRLIAQLLSKDPARAVSERAGAGAAHGGDAEGAVAAGEAAKRRRAPRRRRADRTLDATAAPATDATLAHGGGLLRARWKRPTATCTTRRRWPTKGSWRRRGRRRRRPSARAAGAAPRRRRRRARAGLRRSTKRRGASAARAKPSGGSLALQLGGAGGGAGGAGAGSAGG